MGKSGCPELYVSIFLTHWLSIEKRELSALSLVKSMMWSRLTANSRHLLTRPSEVKWGPNTTAQSLCTCKPNKQCNLKLSITKHIFSLAWNFTIFSEKIHLHKNNIFNITFVCRYDVNSACQVVYSKHSFHIHWYLNMGLSWTSVTHTIFSLWNSMVLQ